MLYRILKVFVRLAMLIFCRRIVINDRAKLNLDGPVLLACNHPNSFLDAVILDVLFKKPVWSLARGDAFKNKFITRILLALKILPVYRTSEGVENLADNYKTFEDCISIFRKNGLVLIFSEGKCVNEWHLRPLKKGTARLALKSWKENIPLKVLPVGINYSSFRRFGKNIFLNFGEVITMKNVDMNASDGLQYVQFNNQLEAQLGTLVYEIDRSDNVKRKRILGVNISRWSKFLMSVPAMLGWLIHAPLYLPVRHFVYARTKDNDHYDSVMTGVLLFSYPLYIGMILCILLLFLPWHLSIVISLFCIFSAWAHVQVKRQI